MIWLSKTGDTLDVLCKFSFVVHRKCSGYWDFVWTTKINWRGKRGKTNESRTPESTSQLIVNQEKTGANSGPKWLQI